MRPFRRMTLAEYERYSHAWATLRRRLDARANAMREQQRILDSRTLEERGDPSLPALLRLQAD